MLAGLSFSLLMPRKCSVCVDILALFEACSVVFCRPNYASGRPRSMVDNRTPAPGDSFSYAAVAKTAPLKLGARVPPPSRPILKTLAVSAVGILGPPSRTASAPEDLHVLRQSQAGAPARDRPRWETGGSRLSDPGFDPRRRRPQDAVWTSTAGTIGMQQTVAAHPFQASSITCPDPETVQQNSSPWNGAAVCGATGTYMTSEAAGVRDWLAIVLFFILGLSNIKQQSNSEACPWMRDSRTDGGKVTPGSSCSTIHKSSSKPAVTVVSSPLSIQLPQQFLVVSGADEFKGPRGEAILLHSLGVERQRQYNAVAASSRPPETSTREGGKSANKAAPDESATTLELLCKVFVNPDPGLADPRAPVQQRQAYSKRYTDLKRGPKAPIFKPSDFARICKPNIIKKRVSGYTKSMLITGPHGPSAYTLDDICPWNSSKLAACDVRLRIAEPTLNHTDHAEQGVDFDDVMEIAEIPS
ncbi:hypothetical protein HPB47_010922 [Ixodes persulcatus]|uniref:Uncharacterized protein n=1 Tax=Ixodes persulcatus TaxID=34615 RepID=A0AC60NXZ1_IXOPE|nr:hypothetical protein HPB47_010922 [Ixodes persulcatus]